MITAPLEFTRHFPLMGLGSAAFFVSLACCCVPAIRRRFSTWYDMPLPSTKQHLLPLDSFRGFAAIWVALMHCVLYANVFYSVRKDLPFVMLGSQGVQVFVVLSGMLIYRSLRNVKTVENLRNYFLRRLLRIYPLYVFTTIGILLFFHQRLDRIVAEIFMLHPLGFPRIVNPPAWSLYVEVLFYLIMPAFVFLARKRVVLAALACIAILAIGERQGTLELGLWKFFFFGVLTSEFIDFQINRKTHIIGAVLFVLGGTLLWTVYISNFKNGLLGYAERELVLALSISLLLCGTVLDKRLRRIFSFRPLRFIGAISYSIYLVHHLILVSDFALNFDTEQMGQLGEPRISMTMALPVATTLDIFLYYVPALLFFSAVSFLVVERPFLNMRPRLTQ